MTRGVKPVVRLLSVMCVSLLLITTMNVLAVNLSATPADAAIVSDDETSGHVLTKQLTLSNNGALLPATASSYSGIIHLAWADVRDDGTMILRWKCSSDNGFTFTSDRDLSNEFLLISDIQIACSDDDTNGVVISFIGVSNTDSNPGVYLMATTDGGKSWTDAIFVTSGRSSSVAMHNGTIYLGTYLPYNGAKVFTIEKIKISGTSFTNAASFVSVMAGPSTCQLVSDTNVIHFALVSEDDQKLVYGCVNYDGILVVPPTVVFNAGFGSITSLDLASLQGTPLIALTTATESGSAVLLAAGPAYGSYWSFSTVSTSKDALGNVSTAWNTNGIYMVWDKMNATGSIVMESRADTHGDVFDSPTPLSSSNSARKPSLIISGQGLVNCIWVQACNPSYEIFMVKDLTFQRPDLLQLIAWINDLDPSIFNGGDADKNTLVTHLSQITNDYHFANRLDAKYHTDALKKGILGVDTPTSSPIVSFNILAVKTALVKDTILSTLDRYTNCEFERPDFYYTLPDGYRVSESQHYQKYISNGEVFSPLPDISYGVANNGVAQAASIMSSTGLFWENFTEIAHGVWEDYEGWNPFGLSYWCATSPCSEENLVGYPGSTMWSSFNSPGIAPPGVLAEDHNETFGIYKEYPIVNIDELSVDYMCNEYSHGGTSASKMESGIRLSLLDEEGNAYDTYTYVFASWNEVYGHWVGWSDDPDHCIILNAEPTMDTWSRVTLHPNDDWDIDWSNCVKVDLTIFTYIERSQYSYLTMFYDNIFIDGTPTAAKIFQIVPGDYHGHVDDMLVDNTARINLLKNQYVNAIFTPESGLTAEISIYDPEEVLRGTYGGWGGTTNIDFPVDMTGKWSIMVRYLSGYGTNNYTMSVDVSSSGLEEMNQQIGWPGDNLINANQQGFAVWAGWDDPLGGHRYGHNEPMIVFNIYNNTYQMSTNYLLAFTYYSSSDLEVSVFNGTQWVTIGTLPGRTGMCSATLVLPCSSFFDSMPDNRGMNILLRFSSSLALSAMSAVSYSYPSAFYSPETHPAIVPENGWTTDNNRLNGDMGATLLVRIPTTEVQYILKFNYQDDGDNIPIYLQTSSSSWISLEPMKRWGRSIAVVLDQTSYYDADSTDVGMSVRLMIASPILNLSSAILSPGGSVCNVGLDGLAHTENITDHPLGVSLDYHGGMSWGEATVVDGKNVRPIVNDYGVFALNGMVSGAKYIVTVSYKAEEDGYISMREPDVYCADIVGDGDWHQATFAVDPSGQYGNMHKCEYSVTFIIQTSGSTTTYIAQIGISIDTDSDSLSDISELNVYQTNPYGADTDGDSLPDGKEVAEGTDPVDPDGDRDGIFDGNEVWSQEWSSEEMYSMPDYSNLDISLHVPALTRVTGIHVMIGLIHPDGGNVNVMIKKDGEHTTYYQLHYPGETWGADLFESYDLISMWYPHWDLLQDFSSANTWHIIINDFESDGRCGQVQYVKILASGTTNATNPDTDGDGISDGEEKNTYFSNPVLVDTDSDGLSDYAEVNGQTPCDAPTDPVTADTDGDGQLDNVDKALGNMMLDINIQYVCDNTEETSSGIFFVIAVGDNVFATERIRSYDTNPDLHYYIDVSDDASSITTEFKAWMDSPSSNLLGEDRLLRINGASTCESVIYDLCPGTFINIGYEGEILVVIRLSTYVLQKAQTIIIASANGTTTYGLDQTGENTYHYSSDQQLYVVYVNCLDGSDSRFVQGLNTILVPRYVALESQLNYTFADLSNRLSGTVLRGAMVYSTSPSTSSTSSSVIMIVSASLTLSQANELLTMLTHDSSGNRIGENVTISGDSVYLLGFPKDVLNSVACQNLYNSEFGDAPQYYDSWFDMLVDVVTVALELVYDSIVEAVNFVVALAQAVIDLGLQVLGSLGEALAIVIKETVDAIANAFNLFVEWLIDFVCDVIFEAIFESVIFILDSLDEWADSIMAQLEGLANGVLWGVTSQVEAADSLINSIVNSNVFQVLLIVVGAILVTMLVIQPVVAPYMFVLPVVASLIIGALFGQEILDAASEMGTAIADDIVGSIESILGDEFFLNLTEFETTMFDIIFGTVGSLMAFCEAAVAFSANTFIGLAVSLLGALLSFAALASDDILIAAGGLVFSFVGFVVEMSSGVGVDLDDLLCAGFKSVSKVISILGLGVSAVSLGLAFQED